MLSVLFVDLVRDEPATLDPEGPRSTSWTWIARTSSDRP